MLFSKPSFVSEDTSSSAPLAPKPHHRLPRWFLFLCAVLVSVPMVFLSATILYIVHSEGRVYQGVYLGDRYIGGFSKERLRTELNTYSQHLLKEGITINLTTTTSTQEVVFPVVPLSPDGTLLVDVSRNQTIDRALGVGRSESWVRRIVEPWQLLVKPRVIFAVPALASREAIIENLKPLVARFESQPQNAKLLIVSTTPLVYTVKKEHEGQLVDYDDLIKEFRGRVDALSTKSVAARVKLVVPSLTSLAAEQVAQQIPHIIAQGPVTLSYTTDTTKADVRWVISTDQLLEWFTLGQDNAGLPIAMLNPDALKQYLNAVVVPDINQPAYDAKFRVEDNRVVEFQKNQSGLIVDVTSTIQNIETTFAERAVVLQSSTSTVSVVVQEIPAQISLAEVNSWGIAEIVGEGTSTFKDSHTNRIKNIANAVKRLNGILIKPGEDFSTNAHAGPYILANGFLPEMVIKGDKIVPEVGGGMCQIGTTVFRMAMNTGLPITERHNHSLVVSYYADPVNHNPGTDATLYEPLLDLKFMNDTGNYLLLTTDIDYKKQLLTFTLWGKSDGRQGSYSRPIVKKWIDAGAPKDIISPDLAPGERKCQNAFRGAVATFTYSRITATGEHIDRVFDSYYRPLPKICMVGPVTPSLGPSVSSQTEVIDTVVPVAPGQ